MQNQRLTMVNHNHLMRKLYHMGVQDDLWTILDNLHCNATSSVKLGGRKSETFNVNLGVRQGGILSTDLYKVHINSLLQRLQMSTIGGTIGSVGCCAPTCADDIALLSNNPDELQILINMAVQYSVMERYQLQPTKSHALIVNPTSRSKNNTDYEWRMKTKYE